MPHKDTRHGLSLLLWMCLCLGMKFESTAIFFHLERIQLYSEADPKDGRGKREKAGSPAFLSVDYVMPGVHLASTSGEIMYFLTVQAGLSQGVVFLAAESMLTIAGEHSRPPNQGRESGLRSAWRPGKRCARADRGQASRARS